MITLTDYTSYDDIRAVLGVSEDDIEDVTVALPTYAGNLELHLSDISSGLIADYVTVAAKAEGARTEQEKRFYSLTRLFSSFAVARDLLGSIEMFAPKTITDGKASVERVGLYDELRKDVVSMYATLRKRLDAAYALVDITHAPVQTVVPIFGVSVGLATDPITST